MPGRFHDFIVAKTNVPIAADHELNKGVMAHLSDGNVFLSKDRTGLNLEAKISNSDLSCHFLGYFHRGNVKFGVGPYSFSRLPVAAGWHRAAALPGFKFGRISRR
jgi:hypothetical protein